MGNRDSSLTRVRPVFRHLLQKDRHGGTWLRQLLRCAEGNPYAQELAKRPGTLLPRCADNCFEQPLPPSERFLLWLISHPGRMTWPITGTQKRPQTFGETTQRWRQKLLRGPAEEVSKAKEEAIKLLAWKGVNGSEGEWWAFEGPTYADCLLETEDLLLLIEGKRTEKLSVATRWYAGRNQIWRNVEAVAAAAGGKRYAVMLLAEQREEVEGTLRQSLPHLKPYERHSLRQHYLGCVLWADLCAKTGIEYADLPDTLGEGDEG